MTEVEWLACTNPTKMLRSLKGKASDRQLRLFGLACCRHIWHLLADERSRNAVEVAERTADGMATEEERKSAQIAARAVSDALYPAHGDYAALSAANAVSADASAAILADAAAFTTAEAADDDDDPANRTKWEAERVWQAEVLREIFGNLFCPVTPNPTWLTPTVRRLARTIYEDRAFDLMPGLADALEEAGCRDADIMSHCRMPIGHVRGCWVIDAILGLG